MPGLEEYVQKAVNYLELYQTRPQHTSSNKIEFYLNSVLDDFREFLSCDNFDISQCIYDKYRGDKRYQAAAMGFTMTYLTQRECV